MPRTNLTRRAKNALSTVDSYTAAIDAGTRISNAERIKAKKAAFDVMKDFGVLTVGYREELKYSVVFKKPHTFQITDFGQDLLTMVYLNFNRFEK